MKKRIKIGSSPIFHNEIETFFNSFLKEYNISRKLYCKIYLAVNEAIVNSMKHGNNELASKFVTLNIEETNDKFIFSVNDEGNGFDYNSISNPCDKENILKESGRGIFIMKQYSDNVIFNQKGNEVKLIFYK